jgi:hypothetical protein
MKTCPKCGEEKELAAFHLDSGKKDGRHTVCKQCRRDEGMAERRARGVRQILHLIVNEDGTAVCPHCNETKLLTQFKSSPTSKLGRSSICHQCAYNRFQKPKSESRLKWIGEYKMLRGCADCGYAEHPHALDFDHLPGTEKLLSLGSGDATSAPWDKVLEEIEKCQVVCANCHRIRTYERRKGGEINNGRKQHRRGPDESAVYSGS